MDFSIVDKGRQSCIFHVSISNKVFSILSLQNMFQHPPPPITEPFYTWFHTDNLSEWSYPHVTVKKLTYRLDKIGSKNLFTKYCVSKSYFQLGMRSISPKILCFCVLGRPGFFHPVSVTIFFVLLDLPLLCSCLRCWFMQNTFHSFQDQPVSSQVQSMGATGLTFGRWEVRRSLVFLLFSTCFRLHLLPWLHQPCGFNSCQTATAAPSQLPAHTIHCGPSSHQVVPENPPAPSALPALGMVPAFCFSHLWAVFFLLFVFSGSPTVL